MRVTIPENSVPGPAENAGRFGDLAHSNLPALELVVQPLATPERDRANSWKIDAEDAGGSSEYCSWRGRSTSDVLLDRDH
jgi:hypothetical protein